MAGCSAATGAIPIPLAGVVLDGVLIGATIMIYHKEFGLQNKTPEELSLLGPKYIEIIMRHNKLGKHPELIASFVSRSLGAILPVEQVAKFIPIVGSIIAGSISFAFTLRFLLRCIGELEEAALAVWDKIAERSIEQDGSTTNQ